MKYFEQLSQQITAAVYQNGAGLITGSLLQEVLLSIVDSMRLSSFEGIATPTTTPVNDRKSEHFYIANTAGNYTNFGVPAVADGEVVMIWKLANTSTWSKTLIGKIVNQVSVDGTTIENNNGTIGVKSGVFVTPTQLSTLSTTVGAKADKTYVDTQLASKASATELANISDKVGELVYEDAVTTSIAKKYISSNTGALASVNSMSLVCVSVEEGEVYRIEATGNVGSAKVCAQYSAESPDDAGADNMVAIVTDLLNNATYPYTITIQEGAKTLLVSKSQTASITIKKVTEMTALEIGNANKSRIESLEGISSMRMVRYKKQGDEITIAYHSGSDDMALHFGVGGGNGLFDIRKIGYCLRGASLDDAIMSRLISTDHIAPFRVRSVADGEGDAVANTHFTGGSYSYENNTSTSCSATARVSSIDIKVDGVTANTNQTGSADVITIVATIYVQGNNTKKADGSGREILKEVVTWSITCDSIKVRTELIPLEDIDMQTWYGYQVKDASGATWIFAGASNRLADQLTSGDDVCGELIVAKNLYTEILRVNTSFDVGKRELYDDSNQSIFWQDNKGYFLVVGRRSPNIGYSGKRMKQGEHFYLEGEYVFTLNSPTFATMLED